VTTWTITFADTFINELLNIPKSISKKVTKKIKILEQDPISAQGDAKKLIAVLSQVQYSKGRELYG
jgi:mRNA-degrading endonuclease RelE of RelBE toxin-antitoxin system